MNVYLVIFCPYGAMSYDTEVLGVFQTKKSATAKIKELIAEEYPARELIISKRKVAA